MKKYIIGAVVAGGLLAATAVGAQLLRGSYDEPKFKSLHTDKPFELRAYEPRIVAKTIVQSNSLRRANSEGFERLAGYIFGGNKAPDGGSQKIAMTTPVEAVPAGTDEFVVTFTMPPKWTMETLPEPKDSRVIIEQLDPKTMATARFSGNARDKDLTELREGLLKYIAEQGYKVESEVTLAQYDPPWTPGPLRRNELMVEVSKSG